MDAWQELISGSTIQTGDAWEHLLAQGGSGPGGSLVLLDGLEVRMEDSKVDVEIDLSLIEVEIDKEEYDVEVDTPEYEVEVS